MTACPPTRSLNVGMVAYGLTPELAMVRVPSERGRWMLVHWCVVAVDCTLCGAISGEPCRSNHYQLKRQSARFPTVAVRHGIGTHAVRRTDAMRMYGSYRGFHRLPAHKIRITADELQAAGADLPPTEKPQP